MQMFDLINEYKDLIGVLASIGTFIAALIAIFTLKEVKKQRLSLYQPDILIKSFTVSTSKNPLHLNNEELLEYKVSDFNDYSKNSNNIEYEVFPKYKVENLGLGVAKFIKCDWQFNTKKAIQIINKHMPDNYSFSHHKDLNLYFLNKLENENFHYSSNANIESQHTDYIAPINVQRHFHFHSVPNIIIFTHYLFLIFKNNLIDKECENFGIFNFNDFNFPKPNLRIEYRDINNKKYKKDIKFNICSVVTQTEEILDMTKDFAYLEFEVN